uniref:non-specific serine/threonine protein kinase n=1 Tax=Ananas comosus var. bracteatus TaxID=296719 RepID=A0A6V7NGR2_ANACO|nr:unnamed protein product [Ananas comosus var. bracteatus]
MVAPCTLQLKQGSLPLWTKTGKLGSVGCYLKMQSNSDLVIYDNAGRRVWASNTVAPNQGNYVCVLQPDGELKVYGPVVWTLGRKETTEVVISATSFTETTATTESETPTIAMVTE